MLLKEHSNSDAKRDARSVNEERRGGAVRRGAVRCGAVRCGAVRCARRELHGRARLVRAEHAGGREKERDKCLGRGKGSRGGRGAWRGETRRNRELFLVSTHDPPRSSRLVLLLSSVSRRALGKLIPIKASRYASAVVQEVGAEFIVSAATSGRRERRGSEREEKDTTE